MDEDDGHEHQKWDRRLGDCPGENDRAAHRLAHLVGVRDTVRVRVRGRGRARVRARVRVRPRVVLLTLSNSVRVSVRVG